MESVHIVFYSNGNIYKVYQSKSIAESVAKYIYGYCVFFKLSDNINLDYLQKKGDKSG
jgi:hypothetical protein